MSLIYITTKLACEEVFITGDASRTVNEWKSHNEQSHPRAKKPMASEVEGLAQVGKQSHLVKMIACARPLTRLLRSLTYLSPLCSHWNTWEPACRLQLNANKQHVPCLWKGRGGSHMKRSWLLVVFLGYKSRILVSLRKFTTTTKKLFLAVKHLLGRMQRNSNKKCSYFHF